MSESPSGTNVTALFAEAAGKSGMLWIDDGKGRTWPVWHGWAEGTVYVVSGVGEQDLPWLPGDVKIILRSKDSGGRLLTVQASVEQVAPDSAEWATAVAALRKARLNAMDDLETRWREECTVRAFHPFGAPVESPGSYAATSGAAPVLPSPATTAGWRPWHVGGRPTRRRRQT